MQRTPTRLIFLSVILAAAALACGLPPLGSIATATAVIANEAATVETVVAATLTALAPTAPATLAETQSATQPVELPTDTPTPEPPTATPPLPPPLRVVYLKDGDVWTWSEAIGSIRLTSFGDVIEVHLSDDGQIAAFVRQSDANYFRPEIWAANTDGSLVRGLFTASDFIALYGAPPADEGIGPFQIGWQPGSHTLVFNTHPIYFGPGSFGNDDLHLLDIDSGALRTVLGKSAGGQFAFSPDGSQMAITRSDSISLINADGSRLRSNVLTFETVVTYSEYLYYPKPIWAPDGSSLRVVIPPADPMATPAQPTTVYFIPTDGASAAALGSIIAMPFNWPDNAFSPDAARLAFVRQVGDPALNQRELHLAEPTGASDSVYFSGEAVVFQGWLPDSNRFIFTAYGASQGVYLGQIGAGYTMLSDSPLQFLDMRWLDANRYFYLQYTGAELWELRLNTLGGGSLLIDTVSALLPLFAFDY